MDSKVKVDYKLPVPGQEVECFHTPKIVVFVVWGIPWQPDVYLVMLWYPCGTNLNQSLIHARQIFLPLSAEQLH